MGTYSGHLIPESVIRVDTKQKNESQEFAKDFARAGNKWTKSLCQMDSDRDGKTNGAELGDPYCTWSVGKKPTKGISSNPGDHFFLSLLKCGAFQQARRGTAECIWEDFQMESYKWSRKLCETDSDNDGLTNGYEFGDPDCQWRAGETPSRSTNITHSGFPGGACNAI
ncbi:hypothetical protein Btru_024556 [Bulinus truncatus]|nr:hypothetical protein Btru_024556 [Bulinus truncatus]